MTIREIDLPFIGGQWCGSAWGYTVYYSETTSLNLTLFLVRLSEQGIGYNFDFKISYKFLRKSDAYLRYGNSSTPSWRGNLIPSTYCDRILDQCDARSCRIQSPNYPGVYPRNITCYYRVEERKTRHGKYALVSVNQHNAHKVHIKDQVVKYEKSQRKLRVWEQCNVIQDYLTVYDGMSTDDPVLVRLCGGDVVPEIISSGPNMLLEFHTSPYDNPFHPVPLSYLPGFELNVKIIYVDARSPSYAQDGKCAFLISSFNQQNKWGYIENTRHSLPPNSTCTYHFQGRDYQNVWIAFVKYYASSTDPGAYHFDEECNARLRIWDGDAQKANVSIMGDFCRDKVPKLCDHTMLTNGTRFTRPCSSTESYISSGSDVTIEVFLRRGSVLFPLHFQLRYEFVDNSVQGKRISSTQNRCDLLFDSSSPNSLSGKFHSPRNVFLYGRGGTANLSCRLTFVPRTEEKVRLKFNSMRFGNRTCQTQLDERNGKMRCIHRYSNGRGPLESQHAEIWISEYPWPGIRIARHCLCSQMNEPFVVSGLMSSALEVNFTVIGMNVTEDFDDYNFHGDYHFMNIMSSSDSRLCTEYKASKRVHGSSGEITNINLADEKSSGAKAVVRTDEKRQRKRQQQTQSNQEIQICGRQPWLIEPEDSSSQSYLYVKVRGFELPSSRWKSDTFQCPTVNRILVYSLSDSRNPKVICPTTDDNSENSLHLVEIFSDGWNVNQTINSSNNNNRFNLNSRSLLIEILDIVPAVYSVRWLEVTKRPYHYNNIDTSLLATSVSSQIYDCPYRCPELNACIKPELWCDGFEHCPSGYDESDINCLHFPVPILYAIAGAGILLTLTILILITSWCRYRRSRHQHPELSDNSKIATPPVGDRSTLKRRRDKKKRASSASSAGKKNGANVCDDFSRNGDVYCKRYTINGSDLYLDRKDSLC